MSQLHRLVYTSFRKPACTDEEIEKILIACKQNNPKKGVTGILLHAKNRFIQYIEGEKQKIQDLYELIKDDDRHTSVNIRSFEPIDKRIFPSWEMGYKDLEKDTLAFQTAVSSEDRQLFDRLIKAELDFTNEGMRVLQLFYRA